MTLLFYVDSLVSSKWFNIQQRSVIYWKNLRKLHSCSAFQVIWHSQIASQVIWKSPNLKENHLSFSFSQDLIILFCFWTFQPQNVINLLLVEFNVCIVFWQTVDLRCKWKSDIFLHLHPSNKSHSFILLIR